MPLCLLLLLLPASASAKQFYPVTMTFAGDPACARRPEQRTLIVDGNAISFRNPFETCVGQLAPDRSFTIACSGAGRGVSYKLSGKITGRTVAGDFDTTNEKRRAGAVVNCTGTFRGTRRSATPEPAAKPAAK